MVTSPSEPNLVKTEFYNDFRLRISPRHMRRQMVMRVRDKPHAIKRLRAHTFNLVFRTESDKENRNSALRRDPMRHFVPAVRRPRLRDSYSTIKPRPHYSLYKSATGKISH